MAKDKPAGSVAYTAPSGAKVTAIPSKYHARMLRVAIYCRVSTLHDDQLNSLEAQLDYYRDYVRSRLNMVLVAEYTDIRSGRSADDRAQFSAMIQDCLAGKIDLIETMLKNEKYTGDVLVYKTYCDEYPKKKRIVNKGQAELLKVEDHHDAIIPKETFEAVQAEIIRRSNIEEDEEGNTRRKSTHYSTK